MDIKFQSIILGYLFQDEINYSVNPYKHLLLKEKKRANLIIPVLYILFM